MSETFSTRYGPWALVAGASEGIGEAFATSLAARGLNVVLLARRADLLEAAASRLTKEYGVDTRCLVADLSDARAIASVEDGTADLDVGLLVYNAAASSIGPFLTTELERHDQVIEVNVRSATRMVRHFGRAMADRGRGGIVVMTSLSAFQGSALIATYSATKAFLLTLAEGLSFELRDYGVDVLACCAGATLTPGYLASRPRKRALFSPPEMEAADVAGAALAALGRKPVVIPGARNQLSHLMMHRLLPRRAAVSVMGRAMSSLYGSRD